jgi:hypothetical protein
MLKPKSAIWLFSLLFFIIGIHFSSAQDEEKDSKFFIDNLIDQWFRRQQDSTYIVNYTNELSLRIIGVTKLNYFQLKDRNTDALARYVPEAKVSAGLGITYKWFYLDVTTKIGIPHDNVKSSKAFDFQGRVFGLKQYVELIYKYYFGYEISNTENLTDVLPDSVTRRDDIRTSYLNLEYMYAFNYDKFSFKAPFFYNEIQKKSAGSFVAGANFVSYLLDGDKAILPEEAWPDFNPKLTFHSLYLASLSVRFGYMYSIVIGRNFYITLGLIPGLALSTGDYSVDNRELIGLFPSFNIKTMNAIGYNSRRFYGGIQFEGDLLSARIDKKENIGIGHGKGKLFVGYRFKRK